MSTKIKKLEFNQIAKSGLVTRHFSGIGKELYWVTKTDEKNKMLEVYPINQSRTLRDIHKRREKIIFKKTSKYYFTDTTQAEIKNLLKEITENIGKGTVMTINKLQKSIIE